MTYCVIRHFEWGQSLLCLDAVIVLINVPAFIFIDFHKMQNESPSG